MEEKTAIGKNSNDFEDEIDNDLNELIQIANNNNKV